MWDERHRFGLGSRRFAPCLNDANAGMYNAFARMYICTRVCITTLCSRTAAPPPPRSASGRVGGGVWSSSGLRSCHPRSRAGWDGDGVQRIPRGRRASKANEGDGRWPGPRTAGAPPRPARRCRAQRGAGTLTPTGLGGKGRRPAGFSFSSHGGSRAFAQAADEQLRQSHSSAWRRGDVGDPPPPARDARKAGFSASGKDT